MARCIHLHDAGVQCISEALSDSDFCEDHQPYEVMVTEELPGRPLQKLFLKLIALLLLLLLLVPFYRVVRTLYLTPYFGSGEPR